MASEVPKATEREGGGTAPSPIPPAGTLVLCLVTLGTGVVQSLCGWLEVSLAIGIPRSHVSLFALLSTLDGQLLPVWLTLLTYVFPHGGWWHVLPNMTGLWLFGAIAEREVGTRRFVAGYFLSGILGVFTYGWVVPHTENPLAGASLAIAGLVGAYASWRWLRRKWTRTEWLVAIAVEAAAVAVVVLWLALRTVPSGPNLVSSVGYHFLPFLVMWMGVQAWFRCRRRLRFD